MATDIFKKGSIEMLTLLMLQEEDIRNCFGKVGLVFLEMFFTEKLLSSRRVACGRDERGGERQRGNGKNRKSNCANGSCSLF